MRQFKLLKSLKKLPKVSKNNILMLLIVVVIVGYIVIKNRKEGAIVCKTKVRSGSGKWGDGKDNCDKECKGKSIFKIRSHKNSFGRISSDYGCLSDDEIKEINKEDVNEEEDIKTLLFNNKICGYWDKNGHYKDTGNCVSSSISGENYLCGKKYNDVLKNMNNW